MNVTAAASGSAPQSQAPAYFARLLHTLDSVAIHEAALGVDILDALLLHTHAVRQRAMVTSGLGNSAAHPDAS